MHIATDFSILAQNCLTFLHIYPEKTVDKYCESGIIKTNGNDYGIVNGNVVNNTRRW